MLILLSPVSSDYIFILKYLGVWRIVVEDFPRSGIFPADWLHRTNCHSRCFHRSIVGYWVIPAYSQMFNPSYDERSPVEEFRYHRTVHVVIKPVDYGSHGRPWGRTISSHDVSIGGRRVVSEDSWIGNTSLILYFLFLPFPSLIVSRRRRIFFSPDWVLCSPILINSAILQNIIKFRLFDSDNTGYFRKYGITYLIKSSGFVASYEWSPSRFRTLIIPHWSSSFNIYNIVGSFCETLKLITTCQLTL